MMSFSLVGAAIQLPEAADATALAVGWGAILRSAVILGIGLPLLMILSRWARNAFARRSTAQHALVAGKLVFYPGVIILMITVLRELGFGLTPILGAAGVVGIAIGFASQTSVSNVISGLFLIAERPFQVNDLIQVGSTTGRVLSIDTLSIKLRTFDNRFVRIPNETIVKSEVTTITRFPIRRLDIDIGIAYKEDVSRVRAVLLDVVAKNPAALMEPAPQVFVEGYGESSVDLRLGAWVVQEKFIHLKISLLEEVKARFDAEGIEIPFPHRTLYPGSEAGPFPIRLDPDGEASPDPGPSIEAESDSPS